MMKYDKMMKKREDDVIKSKMMRREKDEMMMKYDEMVRRREDDVIKMKMMRSELSRYKTELEVANQRFISSFKPTHSLTHSFTHSFTPSLIHSLTPSLPHSLTQIG